MTDEQINIAIAEAFGLEHDASALGLKAVREGEYRGVIPSYTTDLNAMHEAEKVLNVKQREGYAWEIIALARKNAGIANHESHYPVPFVLFATARQRAEAFLRTLGKWEEVQP